MTYIGPARGIARYRENEQFIRYSRKRKERREEGAGDSRPGTRLPPFPYGKDSELHKAEEAARSIAGALAAAHYLRIALEELRGRSSSALERRLVQSSRPDIVTGTAEPGSPLYLKAELEVRRLAQTQLSSTALFAPDSPTTMHPGFTRIRLSTAAGGDYEIECFLSREDTHRSALHRLQGALKEAKVPLRSTLMTDSETGRIRLVLESLQTGAAGAFGWEDLSGNAIASTGLHRPDRPASDAEYRLNGGEWASGPSNSIRLQGEHEGISLAFHSISSATVTLTVTPDPKLVARKLSSLLSAVGLLHARLTEGTSYLNPTLSRSLRNIMSGYQLEALCIQIRAEEDGLYVLREEEFLRQAEAEAGAGFGKLRTALNEGPTGLIGKLAKLVDRMEGSPAEALLDRQNSRFKRYANYMANLEEYSQLPAQGLLLNDTF